MELSVETHGHLGRDLREPCHPRGIPREESQSGRPGQGAGDTRGRPEKKTVRRADRREL